MPAATARQGRMGSRLEDAFGLYHDPKRPALEVRVSKLGGRGVFSPERIVMGQQIESCPCLKLSDTETVGGLSDYAFQEGDGVHNLLVLGLGSMYNHSDEPNAEYHRDGMDQVYTATRDIEPNEEILISYGTEWWEGRNLKPK